VQPVAFFSPAKINLFLAVTGRRSDGYHDLVSLVAPLEWGDNLHVAAAPEFSIECDDPAVPVDEGNLVLKAAGLFSKATGWGGGARFRLEKRIPIGSGLGGGSSNAATALRALNILAGEPMTLEALRELAAQIGSDCALFLAGGPAVIRGRGERVEPLAEAAAARLRGRRIVLFKPSFGVGTPWAYSRLAAGRHYLPAGEAEKRLGVWLEDPAAPADSVLYNQFDRVVFDKYLALPTLLDELRAECGVVAGMSGSGSTCYLFPRDSGADDAIRHIRDAWGPSALVVETRIA